MGDIKLFQQIFMIGSQLEEVWYRRPLKVRKGKDSKGKVEKLITLWKKIAVPKKRSFKTQSNGLVNDSLDSNQQVDLRSIIKPVGHPSDGIFFHNIINLLILSLYLLLVIFY